MDIRERVDSLPVFSYYDKESDTVENIIAQLNAGIAIAIFL